ncbi:MAG TPA: UpxY family transcription antiterminator [Chitinophagaceae bacterium]|nr:UpxY family transcription antiterminator [Chitinophagaceae bacterium]
MLRSWYVIYVRSRAEKKVALRLEEEEFEVFCPIKTEIRQWSDRKKKVKVPYFSSYVFIKLNYKNERIQVLQTPGVVRFLFWLKKPAIVRTAEMEQVKDFFQKHKDRNIQKEEIKLGEKYKITTGPFVGKVGVVKEKNGQRAILEVPGLNLKFSVVQSSLSDKNI